MAIQDWAYNTNEKNSIDTLKSVVSGFCEKSANERPHVIIAPYSDKYSSISKFKVISNSCRNFKRI